MKSTVGACIGLVLLLGACGGDDDTTSVAEATDTPVATATSAPTEPTSDDSAEEPTESTAEPETLTTIPGLVEIATSPTAAGPQPMLEWDAVDGATDYALAVLDSAGKPYWAWTGEATSVRLGAAVGDGGGQTAQVLESMTWTVVAFNDSGALVALSEPGPIEP